LLVIAGVARYFVKDGSAITIEPESGVPDANVRLFLLGSAMGALLHQRGLLPLHANAVEVGGRAYAFMGESGAGKSTLAVGFHDQGYRIIADDVCALRFNRVERAMVVPGLPRLRLWKEALKSSGRQPSQFRRSYAGDELWDKFDVPLPLETAVREEVELAGIYLLGKADNFSIRRLQGLEAAEAVFANTYRGTYVPAVGNVQPHWQSCVRLISDTPVFSLMRSWNLSRISGEIQQLVHHATQMASGTPSESQSR
jgi:hypothetical protein